MSSNGEYFATFMTFAALVLEIFVLLSGTANQPVLRDLYFARVAYQGRFTTMGLWYAFLNVGRNLTDIDKTSLEIKGKLLR